MFPMVRRCRTRSTQAQDLFEAVNIDSRDIGLRHTGTYTDTTPGSQHR